jgi:uncharacterized membrane protein YfcA
MRPNWRSIARENRLNIGALIALGCIAGTGAGLLAGLIGIGGGIVVVPVVYYGLVSTGVGPNEAVHVAVATSLAAILPAAVVSFLAHRRAGNTDFMFLRDWGPGIASGVIAAQFVAPHVRGSIMTTVFAVLCLVFAIRFAFPQRFRPIAERPPGGAFRQIAGVGIGVSSGFAGIGGGILTNIVMTLSGLPMHKSIGRAAAAGVVVSVPATLAAALATKANHPLQIGSIDLTMWVCIAPAQAAAAWLGARLAPHISANQLSRVFAIALAATGMTMLHSAAYAMEGSKSIVTANMLVCTDREAAADIPAILADLDREVLVRRLMLILSSGDCTDRFRGTHYESIESSDPRFVKIRLDGYSNAYLVPLGRDEPRANVAP